VCIPVILWVSYFIDFLLIENYTAKLVTLIENNQVEIRAIFHESSSARVSDRDPLYNVVSNGNIFCVKLLSLATAAVDMSYLLGGQFFHIGRNVCYGNSTLFWLITLKSK
jgi:hypothetical protein